MINDYLKIGYSRHNKADTYLRVFNDTVFLEAFKFFKTNTLKSRSIAPKEPALEPINRYQDSVCVTDLFSPVSCSPH